MRAVWATVLVLGCGAGGAATSRSSGGSSVTGGEVQADPLPPASPGVRRAEELLAAGAAVAARDVLQAELDQHPGDARARFDLAVAYEALEDPGRAATEYQVALSLRQEFPEALNNLGLLRRDEGDAAAAVALFERALAARPAFADAAGNLALALEDVGETDAAVSAYRRAITLAPRDARMRANLGLLLVRLDRREEALAVLREALPLARGQTAESLAVGNGLRRAGDGANAVNAMRDAIAAAANGPTPALLAELALAEHAAGDLPAAEATLGRALALDDRYATGHYLLAGMLAARGAYADAARHYERCLAIEPNGSHAQAARERLEAVRQGLRSHRE